MIHSQGYRPITRLLAALMIVLAGISFTPDLAQASLSLSVNPGLIDLEATPGATGSQEIEVSNTGTDPFTVSVVIEPVASAPAERSSVAWLTPSSDAIALEPGEQATVTIGIAVPDDVPSGGYYAKVTFTTSSGDASANSAAIAGQLGVGMMLTIDGEDEIVREGSISRFAPVLEADGRVGFRLQVANQGNVHLIAPTGSVTVHNSDGSTLGSLEFPETPPLLPGAETVMASQGSLPLTPGESYQADAAFLYQDGGESSDAIEATAEFNVSAAVTLAPATVCENLDRGPTLAVGLANDGDLGVMPLMTMALESEQAGSLGAAPVGNGALLWPGEQQTFTVDFPERLVSGQYTLITTVQYDPTAVPIVQETPFQIGGLEGTPAPLCTAPAGTPTA